MAVLYSFSGADCRAYTYFDGAESLVSELGTLHTISVSVHEAKGQARALGHRGVRGLARGVRTIAGSLILTVVNDNPLRSLHDNFSEAISSELIEYNQGWSLDRAVVGTGSSIDLYNYNNRLGTLLPPFNLMLQYVSEANEGGQAATGAGALIRSIDLIDEGLVTSVNDIVSEVTFSFIACDFKPLSRYDLTDVKLAAQKAAAQATSTQHQEREPLLRELLGLVFNRRKGI